MKALSLANAALVLRFQKCRPRLEFNEPMRTKKGNADGGAGDGEHPVVMDSGHIRHAEDAGNERQRQEEDGDEGEEFDVVALLDSGFGGHDALTAFLDGCACEEVLTQVPNLLPPLVILLFSAFAACPGRVRTLRGVLSSSLR